jgi:hypothetical protein
MPAGILGALPLLLLWKGGSDPRAIWILGIVTGVVALWESRRTRDAVLPQALAALALAYAFWTILSFLASTTQTWGFDELIRDAACMTLLHLGAERSGAERTLVLRMILGTAVLAALVGIVIYILQPEDRLVGTFFDVTSGDFWPNAFASLALLAWPLALIVAPKKSKVVLAGFLVACLGLTGSRGALLALLVQLGIAAALWLRSKHMSLHAWKEHLLPIMTACACVLITIGIGRVARHAFFAQDSLPERMTFSESIQNTSVSERWHFWQEAEHLAEKKPFFGWGPDSFGSVAQRFQAVAAETSAHPHSMFWKLLAERGFPAAIIFLLMAGLMLHAAFCRKHGKSDDPWRLLLGLSLTGVLLHNLIDTTLAITGIAIPFWLLAGLAASRSQESSAPRPTRWIVAIASLALIGMSAAEFLRPTMLRGTTELQEAVNFLAQNDLAHAARTLRAFRRLSPEEPQGAYFLAQFFVQNNTLDEAKKYYKEAFEKGGWNSPAMVAEYLRTLARTNDAEMIHAIAPNVRAMTLSFASAIQFNRHRSATGDIPEQFAQLMDVLMIAYPKNAQEWKSLRDHAAQDAELWRNYAQKKPKGILW